MNKRTRFFVILISLAIGGWFLYPSLKWYLLTPKELQQAANLSRSDIRDYARDKAREALRELLAKDESEPLPEEFQFLIPIAKENYKVVFKGEKKTLPDEWTVRNTLGGFISNAEIYQAIEDYYREEILDLKTMKNKTLQLGLDIAGGISVVLQAIPDSLVERYERQPTDAEVTHEVDVAMAILNNRIDLSDMVEPQIRRQSTDQILIELPGEPDPDRVDAFLLGKGSLSFHIQDTEATQILDEYVRRNPGDPMIDGKPEDSTILPAGTVVKEFYKKDSYGVDQFDRYIAVKEEVGLDGSHITQVTVSRDPSDLTAAPVVIFHLDSEGADIFYKLTEANVNKVMTVVQNNKVKAAAGIREPIPGGVASVSGFSEQEAYDLSLILQTAALPVELEMINMQEVGATLGRDIVSSGVKAISVGFFAVIIFMILYYKLAGVVASIALLLNLFFISAILSAIGMTITLTGFAGLILTVGMAVDANVIIYERIREELRLGKSRAAAIEGGYKKALITVMDANITTLIAALFLSLIAKGPVQGFAVTLAVGVVFSLFTAIFVSRLFFDFGTDVLKKEKMSIGWGMNR